MSIEHPYDIEAIHQRLLQVAARWGQDTVGYFTELQSELDNIRKLLSKTIKEADAVRPNENADDVPSGTVGFNGPANIVPDGDKSNIVGNTPDSPYVPRDNSNEVKATSTHPATNPNVAGEQGKSSGQVPAINEVVKAEQNDTGGNDADVPAASNGASGTDDGAEAPAGNPPTDATVPAE